MARLDHIILKVNDLDASIDFYTRVMGFTDAGEDGPFTVIRTCGFSADEKTGYVARPDEGRPERVVTLPVLVFCPERSAPAPRTG